MTMAHTGKAPFSGTLETSVCHQMYRCTAQESCRRAQQANAKRDYLVVNYQDISWGEPPPLAPGDPCPLRRFLGSETPRVNLQKTYGKSPSLTGQSAINHHFQYSYVKLPEGNDRG